MRRPLLLGVPVFIALGVAAGVALGAPRSAANRRSGQSDTTRNV
jgi:hypothetical protein